MQWFVCFGETVMIAKKLVHKGNFDPWPIVSSDAVSKAKPAELADL